MTAFQQKANVFIAIVSFNSMLNFLTVSAEYQSNCQLNPTAIFRCIQNFEDLDWSNVFNVVVEVNSPSHMMMWTDDERQKWIEKLRSACKPFNKISDCTGRNGARRWWNCIKDEGMKTIIGNLKSAYNESTEFEPYQVRDQFDAVEDLCEPSFIDEFDKYHLPCMKAVFDKPTPNIEKYIEQVKEVDAVVEKRCYNFNCKAATAYNKVFVYPIVNKCKDEKVHQTSHRLVNSYLRLNMMNSEWKIYCHPDDLSRGVDDYKDKPRGVLSPTANCQVTTSRPRTLTVHAKRTTTVATTSTTRSPHRIPTTTLEKDEKGFLKLKEVLGDDYYLELSEPTDGACRVNNAMFLATFSFLFMSLIVLL